LNEKKPGGGRSVIEATMARVKSSLGVSPDRDWLEGYYQYCNRIAALDITTGAGTPARLLFVYFCGDRSGPGRTCPSDALGWSSSLADQAHHVGLPAEHRLASRIHHLFLAVDPSGGSSVR
jgi:hypothetical protein